MSRDIDRFFLSLVSRRAAPSPSTTPTGALSTSTTRNGQTTISKCPQASFTFNRGHCLHVKLNVSTDIRDSKRSRTDDVESPDRKRRYADAGRDRARDRFGRGGENGMSPPTASPAGFGGRPNLGDDYSDEEDDGRSSRRRGNDYRRSGSGGGGGISRHSGCKSIRRAKMAKQSTQREKAR